VVKIVGSDEVATSDSEPDPAYVGAILTTTATDAQVYDWYAHWLSAHGYHQVTYYRTSDQTSGVAWRAPGGREQVQIGVFDTGELAAQQHISVAARTGTVVYEQLFVGYRVNTH
jgi:predicted heme/steroid binding protein